MSDDVERVKALREAFVRGWRQKSQSVMSAQSEARLAYPMPMLHVYRIVQDPSLEDYEWSCRGECLYRRHKDGGWTNEANCAITRERVAMWADLIANPFEQKPADEVEP